MRDKTSTTGDTTNEGERREAEEGEKPSASVEKGGRGRRRFLALAGKGQEGIRGRQTGGDWNGVFPRRVLLLVFVFQRGVFEDERKDNDTRGTHLNAVRRLILASLAGCVNVGLTLPIWTVVAKMQVASKTPKRRDIDAEDAERE